LVNRIDANSVSLKDQVVSINRVTKVVKGGKNLSFAALVVVGDGAGTVGWGSGKAREVPAAIRKAIEAAKKSLVRVHITATSIPHITLGRYGAGQVLLKPAPEGTGVIAGGYAALVKSAEGVEDDVNAGIAGIDTHGVTAADFVVGIAASGSTPYVRAALARAQTLGARTGLVACAEPPRLLRDTCDVVVVPDVGPEVITGSTRMKAGTATKLVLNTITTGAMIRLGKVYGNLMVDLMAWSEKLVDRGERIVMECAGVDRAAARAAIAAAGGSVKLAIVMVRSGVSAERARALLADAGGLVRRVVGDPPPVSPAP